MLASNRAILLRSESLYLPLMRDEASDELTAFKTGVNLTEFAVVEGYVLDPRSSSRNSVIMVNQVGDKIVIAKEGSVWVYFSVRDDRDNGTIIDFIQRRRGVNLGQVRRILRPWIGAGGSCQRPRPDPLCFVNSLEPVSRDAVAVRARFEGMRPIETTNQYLVQERGVPSSLLSHPKLLGSIRTDDRGNVCFAHSDCVESLAVCGFEMKNQGFTGFATGGIKGLWSTVTDPGDTRVAIAESAIDAMSYAAVRGIQGTRLVSIAGQMNARQPALLRSAMEALPLGGRVIAAMDHDASGEALAAKVHAVFTELGRADLTFVVDLPPAPGADWNDELRRRASSGPTPSPG